MEDLDKSNDSDRGDSNNEPIEKSKHEDADESNNEPIEKSKNEDVDESNNEPIEKSKNEDIDESNNKEIDETNNEDVEDFYIEEAVESYDEELDKFDQLVKKNKDSGEHWYHGLNGKWWWGLPEDQVRNKIASGQVPRDFDQTHKHRRIAVASIIRNEERNGNLKKFFDCCQRLEEYDDVVYILIEGDSSDNTYVELQDWLSTRDNYILKKNR